MEAAAAIITYAAEVAAGLQALIKAAPTVENIAAQFQTSNDAIQAMVTAQRPPTHDEWAALLQAQRAAFAAAPVITSA